MDNKKPHTFSASEKPFKVQIDFKNGAIVTGYSEERKNRIYYYSRFTTPVAVTKGDVFYMDRKKGFMLNGIPVHVNMRPAKKCPIKMAWAASRLRVAVFRERDRVWSRRTKKFTKKLGKPYWVAMDTRSYWLGCGNDVQTALIRLLQQVQFTQLMDKEERGKGVNVIRWHCERQKDVRTTLKEAEEKAKKTGFILEGIDWQKSLVGKATTKE